MMSSLNIEEIYKILPQRFPFVMIDRVTELEPRKKVVALKNVSYNEEFFAGHFPNNPVMPGVLIIEAMAQASIILFCGGKDACADKKLIYYLGAVKTRFMHPVVPGDQLIITVEPLKIISRAAIVKAKVQVLDKEVASAEISLVAK
ncbi:MAG: 3-hydroxyacyl-ACP dehydratase FabZ [Candidatus Omnitrophica bacterium]|nr:3-hydroxyacyl-ACP dehydratase FabZ [Candidatus Omnitrophota bacterium]